MIQILVGPETAYDYEDNKSHTTTYIRLDNGETWCYLVDYLKDYTEMYSINPSTVAGIMKEIKINCVLEFDKHNPERTIDRFNKLLLLK